MIKQEVRHGKYALPHNHSYYHISVRKYNSAYLGHEAYLESVYCVGS